jgi:hypothetical protein
LDFNNSNEEAKLDETADLPFVPVATKAVFRSRRPTLLILRAQTAELALIAADHVPIPIDALLKRTNGKRARITPRLPGDLPASEPRFSIFKTVNAMRGQSGYRLRP